MDTFIFSFVRMNPPTPGHLLLIKTMIYKAIELGSDKVYILTSSSLDGKNPLPCSSVSIPKPKTKADASVLDKMSQNKTDLTYKSSVLDKMISSYKNELVNAETNEITKKQIENLNVNVLCSIGVPFSFIYSVIQKDFINIGIPKINMFFIVGRDRADFLDTIVDNFIAKDYVRSIDGMILEREGMESLKSTGIGQRSIVDINLSEYSASFVRNLVKSGNYNDFVQVYKTYLSEEDIKHLYETIQMGIQMKSPASKNENEKPISKYYDGHLLPVMNTSVNESVINKLTVSESNESKKRKRTSYGGKKNTKKTTKNKNTKNNALKKMSTKGKNNCKRKKNKTKTKK